MRQTIKSIIIGLASACLAGCISSNESPTGLDRYEPTSKKSIHLLDNSPDSSTYEIIGSVSATGAPLASKEAVFEKLKKPAAALGADAVIITYAGKYFRGNTDFGPLYGWEVSGNAIKYVRQTGSNQINSVDKGVSATTPIAEAPNPELLIGHWVGNDGKNRAEFIFSPEGSLLIKMSEMQDGAGRKATYTLKTKTYPWELDCSGSDPTTGHVNTVRMLIEFIDDNTLEAAIGDDTRVVPKNFAARNTMIFKRSGH